MSKENHRITSPVQISLSPFCFISVALLLMPTFLVAQESFVIDSVDAHLEPVADTSAPYELFEQLTNLPHVTTRRSVIDRSVAATVGYHDTVSSQAVDEFEAYLRGLRVFSTVEVEANPSATHPGHADVSVQATDSWSLIVLFEDEPGDSEPLVVLEEQNLLGEAKRIGIGTDLPMIDTGSARWMVRYGDPHLFGSDLQLDVRAVLSAHISDLGFSVERPLFTHKVPVNFGADVRFRTGRETLRYQGDGTATPFFDSIETDKFVATSWVGLPNDEEDLFVGSIAARIDRTLSEAADRPPQAYENTLGLFAGIASVRRRFARRDGYEFSGERFVPTGGTGRVTVGTFLPVADGQDDLLYIGAEARESFL